jgi:ketosteroid isomerase-like protein
MRRILTLVVVGVISSACQSVDVEKEKKALMAADEAWLADAKDIDKFVSHFTPDATMAMASMPAMNGPEVVKTNLGPLMKAPGFGLKWMVKNAEVSKAGDLGYTWGSYQLTLNSPAGTPMVEVGKYQTTWKKVDGTWKVVYDFASPDRPAPSLSAPVVTPAATIKWMDAPPFLPKGAKLAVLSGDPSQPAPFTVRLQMPDGYKIAPHTHPTDEHVTVMSGTFRAAMGEKWNDKALGDFAPGSYANMAAGMAHYAAAKGATVVQVHGVGPFVVNYVNPADDPSKQK